MEAPCHCCGVPTDRFLTKCHYCDLDIETEPGTVVCKYCDLSIFLEADETKSPDEIISNHLLICEIYRNPILACSFCDEHIHLVFDERAPCGYENDENDTIILNHLNICGKKSQN